VWAAHNRWQHLHCALIVALGIACRELYVASHHYTTVSVSLPKLLLRFRWHSVLSDLQVREISRGKALGGITHGLCCLFFNTEDGVVMVLRNVGRRLTDYTLLCPRRQWGRESWIGDAECGRVGCDNPKHRIGLLPVQAPVPWDVGACAR
jgi:hypothetical protein